MIQSPAGNTPISTEEAAGVPLVIEGRILQI